MATTQHVGTIYVGVAAELPFTVRTSAEVAVTGLTSSDISWVLRRRTSSGNFELASETMTLAERGDGAYILQFTPAPDADGYEYWAEVVVTGGSPGTEYARQDFFVAAVSNADGYTEDDSHCSVADVRAVFARGPFAEIEQPNADQVIVYAAWRAAELDAAMAAAGYAVTVASGSNPVSASTDPILEVMLRNANAAGAAAELAQAFEVRETGENPEQAKLHLAEYERLKSAIVDFILATKGDGAVRTSTSTGGIQQKSFVPVSTPHMPTKEELWSMTTEM